MALILAPCGLNCADCDAFKATKTNDDALRAATAARWSKDFNFAFSPAMINCSGCTQSGVKIGHCTECEMRACSVAKGLANCGLCAEYPDCAKIAGFLKDVPTAKAALDAARAGK